MDTRSLSRLLLLTNKAAEESDAEARTEQPHRARAADDDSAAPRLVTRGESFPEEIPFAGGESLKLYYSNGQARAIATPLPKVDGNPIAALTDWLNISFPFPDGRTGIPKFLNYLRQHLGPQSDARSAARHLA